MDWMICICKFMSSCVNDLYVCYVCVYGQVDKDDPAYFFNMEQQEGIADLYGK